jgi:hypothetical protein
VKRWNIRKKPYFSIGEFSVNPREDYEMYVIIKRIIDSPDPAKLIPTLAGMAKYHLISQHGSMQSSDELPER